MVPGLGSDPFLGGWHTTVIVCAQSRRSSWHSVSLGLARRRWCTRRHGTWTSVLLRRFTLLDARGRRVRFRFGACFRARAGKSYVRVQVNIETGVVQRATIGWWRHLARDHRRCRCRCRRCPRWRFRRRRRRVTRGLPLRRGGGGGRRRRRCGLRASLPWGHARRRGGCGR